MARDNEINNLALANDPDNVGKHFNFNLTMPLRGGGIRRSAVSVVHPRPVPSAAGGTRRTSSGWGGRRTGWPFSKSQGPAIVLPRRLPYLANVHGDGRIVTDR